MYDMCHTAAKRKVILVDKNYFTNTISGDLLTPNILGERHKQLNIEGKRIILTGNSFGALDSLDVTSSTRRDTFCSNEEGLLKMSALHCNKVTNQLH